MKRKKIVSLLLVLALLLAMAACAAPGEDTAEQGPGTPENGPTTTTTTTAAPGFPGTQEQDMVTLNVTSEPTDMNPLRMSDIIAQSILFSTMAGLTRLDSNDQPVADMAERWEISEDQTVYTMHLRQDALWSNQDPVTAQDFYDAWVLQMTPETGGVNAAFVYQNIENGEAFYNGQATEQELGIRVVDEHTLEIRWSRPMVNGLFYLAQPFFLPINRAAYEQIGDQMYAKEADKMVTNGAYLVTEWVHDSHMLLTRNEAYYDAATVQIPKVKLVMIGDVNTNLNAFMAGELDMCSLYSEHIAQVKQLDQGAVQSYTDGGSWYLLFNLEDPLLSNKNLRKALAHSIDIQSLLDHVINDGSVAADGLVPASIAGAGGEPYAAARGSLFQYDPQGAKDYLAKALEELDMTAQELSLTFWGTDTTYNQNQAAYLQQQWKQNLGLEVSLKAVPNQALSEAKYNGEFSFAVGGWGPSENDAITFLEGFRSTDLNNQGRYNNPEYDQLIQAAMAEPDSQTRQGLLIQAETLLLEDMAIGPMYFTCTTYGVSDKLEGLTRTPFQYFGVRDASIRG